MGEIAGCERYLCFMRVLLCNRFVSRSLLIAAALLMGCSAARKLRVPEGPHYDPVLKIDPPEEGFYAKVLDCMGIPIKSSSVVPDDALYAASDRLRFMLAKLPDAVRRLRAAGCEVHLIGRREPATSLPEMRHLKGLLVKAQPDEPWQPVDRRLRGVTSLFAIIPEENLRYLIRDDLRGTDVAVHELAHMIMNFGLNEGTRQAIGAQYRRAMSKGLWQKKYAHENTDEYFAELSTWYFAAHGDDPNGAVGIGREGLRAYDSAGYALLDRIYSGVHPIEDIFNAKDSLIPFLPISTLHSKGHIPCEVRFVNLTPSPIEVDWISYEGLHVRYAVLSPDSSITQSTYAAHAWMIIDSAGHDMMEFRTTFGNQLAIVRSNAVLREYGK